MMNKRFFMAAAPILAVMVSLFSCASPEPKVSVISFSNKVQNITFSATETKKVEWLYFTNSWSSENTNEWLEVTPRSHSAANPGRLDSVEVTFRTLSPALSERRGRVTFSQEDAMVSIPVIQQVAPVAN